MTDEPSPLAVAEPRVGVVAWLLILLVRLYQKTLSYLLGGQCRFTPSCSHYALAVLRTHGAIGGTLRAVRRVSKCHPFHPGGYDPPPPAPKKSS
ncbi:MAG: membrane protein insertion efficiency factor YidD [Polyangiales bacterium]